MARKSWIGLAGLLLGFLPTVLSREVATVESTDEDGATQEFRNNRYPALYTGAYGDCLGGESLFNITKYDAGYYADNMTLVFHLDGNTNIREEDVVLHLTIDAYGESRFNKTIDPCESNITSLCPLSAENPIEAWANISVSPSDLDGIPSIALDIPDFEGSARMRIFANSSQTEIGCFQAVMHNGNTLSHPYAISSALGGITALAILSSFATAIYGVSIPHMRTHYAHSFSVLVVFEAFHTIYFSGALSVNWPRILSSWWSNFSWSAGIIYSKAIVDSLNGFAGVNGNASQVGGAGSAVINTGGGLIQQIYGRSLDAHAPASSSALDRRAHAAFNPNDPWDYSWAGNPVTPGMPTPGIWTGFPGTLSSSYVPAADAFLVGLIWWAVALGLAVVGTTGLKLLFDLLAALKWMPQERFAYFRSHLLGYLAVGVLRTLLVASFALITLALFQFNLDAPAGPIAISAVVFALLLSGMGGLIAYACYFRLRFGKFEMGPDHIVLEQGKLFKVIPFVAANRASKLAEDESAVRRYGTLPFFRIRFVDDDPNRNSVHKDEAYIKRFGWLTGHYRRTRWWFFALWFSYQFARACFLGGGARNPLAQVFGLFVLEVIAFVVFVKIRPYEGQRNSVVAIWMLGLCKVITTGLSIAFLPDFEVGRIALTILGIIIVVVQGFLVLTVLVLVVIGMVSSWMSIHRNRETFRPEKMDQVRISYYEHLQNKAPDMPPPRRAAPVQEEEPAPQSFSVTNVRRARKVEDDDDDIVTALERSNNNSVAQFAPVNRPSRTNSVNSRYSVGSLPRRARPARASWSSKDFAEWEAQFNRPESAMGSSIRASQQHIPASASARHRSNSLRQLAHLNSSQSSLRMKPDLQERSRTPGEGARPPLTPTKEAQEDEHVRLEGIESARAREGMGEEDMPAVQEEKDVDSEPFPALGDLGVDEVESEAPAEKRPVTAGADRSVQTQPFPTIDEKVEEPKLQTETVPTIDGNGGDKGEEKRS